MEQIKNELVSVVTITRNRSELLKRCIKSVLSQTYSNIEHIIVDGASEDNTKQIVESFNDNKIKYIQLPVNRPPAECFVIGSNSSNGKYITFLDDDDEYLETKIEKQYNLIESLGDEYKFIYCWMSYFDHETGTVINENNSSLRGDVLFDLIDSPVLGGTPTLFFNNDFFRKIGGWKDNIGISSDWELRARAAKYSKTDFVSESLVKVYVNHNFERLTYTQTKDKKKLFDLIKFHEYFLKEFADTFKIAPKKQIVHLNVLIRYYLIINNYKKSIKLIIKALNISFSDKDIYKNIIKGLVKKI